MHTLFRCAVLLVLLSLPETHAFVNSDVLQFWNTEDPAALFQSILWCLVLFSLALKCLDLYLSFESSNDDGTQTSITKPASIVRLERKFLSVFWLIRTVCKMQSPAFCLYITLQSSTIGLPIGVLDEWPILLLSMCFENIQRRTNLCLDNFQNCFDRIHIDPNFWPHCCQFLDGKRAKSRIHHRCSTLRDRSIITVLKLTSYLICRKGTWRNWYFHD
jgi:hypothetical protein